MAKSAVLIIAQKNFRDEELFETRQVLLSRKITVAVAAPTRHAAIGAAGGDVEPDLAIREVEVGSFDALVFIGGAGSHDYFQDPIARKLIHEFTKARKIVAGICDASSILANAGVLLGKRATGFHTQEKNLVSRGAEYTGMPVEVDGSIVTGRDRQAAQQFGEQIAELLDR